MSSENPPKGQGEGAIDFSRYSNEQLYDLRGLIDPTGRPLDHARLLDEIARREADGAPATDASDSDAGDDAAWPVRFTLRGGLVGWMSAIRHRFPLYGQGMVAIEGEVLNLHGWRRSWLMVAVQDVVSVPFHRIGNVAVEGAFLRFDLGRWRQVEIHTGSPAAARAIAARLPDRRSADFDRRWLAVRQFIRALNAGGRFPWVTWALILINTAIFAFMAQRWQRIKEFPPGDLLMLGANYGPLTASGEWWRLLTAAFLHLDWLHLALNMWALAGVGGWVERLYGRARFIALYLTMAVTASLTSVVWHPLVTSVGASGAIYGVFGLFAAYLLRNRAQVPLSLLRTHGLSSLAFILFSLVSGFLQTGIDNAAHVGGLLSGLILGAAAAGPLGVRGPERWSWPRSGIVATLALVMLVGGYARTRGSDLRLSPMERYMQARAWYTEGAVRNTETWMQLSQQAQAGMVSSEEYAERLEKDILPFWTEAQSKLRRQDIGIRKEEKPFSEALNAFVDARTALGRKLRDQARANFNDNVDLAPDVEAQQNAMLRLQVYQMRAAMSHRPSALANSTAMEVLRRRFMGNGRPCVDTPLPPGQTPVDAGSREDGPYLFKQAACAVQRAFLDEDYAQLESMFSSYSRNLQDLPHGGSSLNAALSGFSALTRYGNLTVEDIFGRTTAWQMAYPNSVYAKFMEAEAYDDWAWATRGHGFAKTVTPQAMELFRTRLLMAKIVLEETKSAAQAEPLWYLMSMSLASDTSEGKEKVRALFEQATEKFPTYLSLHRQMLRTLMPRWFGSYGEVAGFIDRVSRDASADRKAEFYAQLYWIYREFEDEDLDLVKEVEMEWPRVRDGLHDLTKRYPRSDYWLNALAVFACDVGDQETYRAVHADLVVRPSPTAWEKSQSRSECDQKFGITSVPTDEARQSQ